MRYHTRHGWLLGCRLVAFGLKGIAGIFFRFDLLVARSLVLGKLQLVISNAFNQVVWCLQVGVTDQDDRNLVFVLNRLRPASLFIENVVTDVDR